MTLEEKIALLLPKKDTIYTYEAMLTPVQEGYNDCIDQCATNLNKAFERGEIAFVPTEEDLVKVIDRRLPSDWVIGRIGLAREIINLLTKGKDNVTKDN